jgi:hypothetical protein
MAMRSEARHPDMAANGVLSAPRPPEGILGKMKGDLM